MKRFALSVALATFAAASFAAGDLKSNMPPIAPPPMKTEITPSTKVKLADIGWLAGCWISKPGSVSNAFESWTRPLGNMVAGMGVTVKDGKAVAYEYMRIEAKDDGTLVFTAKPFDKPEASFTNTSDDAKNLVFENPKHPFPQRVIYKVEKDGSIEARIDGDMKGERRAALFPMEKADCQ
jgi:Domain of unknown function (DUF6265)